MELFKLHIEDAGIGRVRACADDIGATLHQLQHISVLHKLFESFRKVSGLTLKPKKCNLILTVCSPTESTLSIIHAWFRVNCPAWSNFQVCDTAKYLGFFLGPKAGKKQWVAPLAKFSERYKEVAARGLPLGLVGPEYSCKVVPVLGYVGQLALPPEGFPTKSCMLPTNC